MMKQSTAVLFVVFQVISAQNTYNILGKVYKVIVDREITDVPQPQYIKYANEIRVINRYTYYMKDFTKTNDGDVSFTKKITKRYIPPKLFMNKFGDIMDVQEGLVYFTYREKSYEILTKDNCKTTYMTGSYQSSICFLMCKTSYEGSQKKNLFGYDSSKPKLVENRVIAEELNIFGDDLITVDFNERTGNIAAASKTINGWKLLVLEYMNENESGDEVVTIPVEVITTESIKTSTTTMTTPITTMQAMITTEKVNEDLSWNYDDDNLTSSTTTTLPNTNSNKEVDIEEFHKILEEVTNKINRAHEFNVNRHIEFLKNRNKMLERILETRQIRVNSVDVTEITRNFIEEFKKVVTVNGKSIEKVYVQKSKESSSGDKNKLKQLEEEMKKYKNEAERCRRAIMTSARVEQKEETYSADILLSSIPTSQLVSAFELPTERKLWYDYSCIKNEALLSQKEESAEEKLYIE